MSENISLSIIILFVIASYVLIPELIELIVVLSELSKISLV